MYVCVYYSCICVQGHSQALARVELLQRDQTNCSFFFLLRYAHLTNSSINKHSPSFSSYKETIGAGCKWPISRLREVSVSLYISI